MCCIVYINICDNKYKDFLTGVVLRAFECKWIPVLDLNVVTSTTSCRVLISLGNSYLIYWFPDPSQINFTGLGGR